MKKAPLISSVWLILLASCNLPQNLATNTPDIVATQITMLLTSQPTPQPFTPTAEVQPFPTMEPAATATLTEIPQPSPITPTSTDDPRTILGDPDYIDTLDSGKSFGMENQIIEDEYTLFRVQNGALILTSKYAIGWHGWRMSGTEIKDAYIEAVMQVGDCSGSDTYGVVYRSPDYNQGYWFTLTCGGDWAFGYWDGEGYVNLKNGIDIDHVILSGANQSNRIGVMASGSRHKLYVNGKLISEVEDSTYSEAGAFGAVIAAYNTPNFTVSVSEFAYWKIE